MTDLNLKEGKAKAEAVNAGDRPWEFADREEDDGHIYYPECSYLDDTMVVLSDTYEDSGQDLDYITEACKYYPKALELLERWAKVHKMGHAEHCATCSGGDWENCPDIRDGSAHDEMRALLATLEGE